MVTPPAAGLGAREGWVGWGQEEFIMQENAAIVTDLVCGDT